MTSPMKDNHGMTNKQSDTHNQPKNDKTNQVIHIGPGKGFCQLPHLIWNYGLNSKEMVVVWALWMNKEDWKISQTDLFKRVPDIKHRRDQSKILTKLKKQNIIRIEQDKPKGARLTNYVYVNRNVKTWKDQNGETILFVSRDPKRNMDCRDPKRNMDSRDPNWNTNNNIENISNNNGGTTTTEGNDTLLNQKNRINSIKPNLRNEVIEKVLGNHNIDGMTDKELSQLLDVTLKEHELGLKNVSVSVPPKVARRKFLDACKNIYYRHFWVDRDVLQHCEDKLMAWAKIHGEETIIEFLTVSKKRIDKTTLLTLLDGEYFKKFLRSKNDRT